MILYFDTSALVKLVVVEDGSDIAAQLWESAPAAASLLVYPEGRAALAAARRADRLTPAQHDEALGDFEELNRTLFVVGVDEELSRQAGVLAEELGLRGYDAVHLATAMALGGDDVAMVTWDANLRGAAEAVGLAVAGQ